MGLRRYFLTLAAGLVFGAAPAGALTESTASLTLCCLSDNDVYRLLKENGIACRRVESFSEAVAQATDGSGVLLLADGYPERRTSLDMETLEGARARGLRLYVEFPDSFPGLRFDGVTSTSWERVVVASSVFGDDLPPLRILSASDCHYLPTTASRPLLSIARVAGYDRAVYGLPEDAAPILLETEDCGALVATTALSRFSKGRYGPAQEWVKLWGILLGRLNGSPLPELSWTPPVRPRYAMGKALPPGAEIEALGYAADWISSGSGLLLTADRSARVQELLRAGLGEDAPPSSPASGIIPAGDGSSGILEGYTSRIGWDGRQKQCIAVRADCQAESAMLLAMDAAVNSRPANGEVARRLLDFTYGPQGFCTGPRSDPKHAAYGHIGWGLYAPAWETANYGDDNARVILATLAAAALLGSDRYDAPVLRAVAANFRTTGRNGFRGDRIDLPVMEDKSWQEFGARDLVNLSPHFEAALWGCYLLAYERTGYAPFLEKTRSAIRTMMDGYPSGWRWSDNSERTDMLWTLAWLVRVDDTPEHRQWLDRIAGDLIDSMEPNGALPERFGGGGGGGHYKVPESNEAFGTGESPLLQEDGDPVTDQLYTTAFALIAFHEAAAATGSPSVREAADRLADYLCRIQVRSEEHAWLDGAWLRAFDYKKWDYWASSGDIGWGPWCAEAGWGHVWIGTTLGLRARSTSLWTLLTSRDLKSAWKEVRQEMLPSAGEGGD